MKGKTLTRKQRQILDLHGKWPGDWLYLSEVVKQDDDSKSLNKSSEKHRYYRFIHKHSDKVIELKEV